MKYAMHQVYVQHIPYAIALDYHKHWIKDLVS